MEFFRFSIRNSWFSTFKKMLFQDRNWTVSQEQQRVGKQCVCTLWENRKIFLHEVFLSWKVINMRSQASHCLGSHISAKKWAEGRQMSSALDEFILCSTIPLRVHTLSFSKESMVANHISTQLLYNASMSFSVRWRLPKPLTRSRNFPSNLSRFCSARELWAPW